MRGGPPAANILTAYLVSLSGCHEVTEANMSQLLGTEIFINRRRCLAPRTHREHHCRGTGDGITAGEYALSGRAAFGISLKPATTCGLKSLRRVDDQRIRSSSKSHDHSLGRNLEL